MRFIAFDVLEQDTRTGSARHLHKNNLPVKYQGNARHWPDRSSQVQSHDSMMRRHWDTTHTCNGCNCTHASWPVRHRAHPPIRGCWRCTRRRPSGGPPARLPGRDRAAAWLGHTMSVCIVVLAVGLAKNCLGTWRGWASKRGWITGAAEAGNGGHTYRSA